MRRFAIVWLGQAFSLLGTNVSAFGVTVWAYKETGSATAMALIPFFLVTPMLIVSPLAGALVDRLNRKFMMMISDPDCWVCKPFSSWEISSAISASR
jgi:MFS family permease